MNLQGEVGRGRSMTLDRWVVVKSLRPGKSFRFHPIVRQNQHFKKIRFIRRNEGTKWVIVRISAIIAMKEFCTPGKRMQYKSKSLLLM